MTTNELLACLVDRPCSACKFHTDIGCSKWTCVFEGKIEELPSAERVGHWIEKEDPYGFFNSIPVCSECGCTTKMRERYNYCPNCGARMVSEDAE